MITGLREPFNDPWFWMFVGAVLGYVLFDLLRGRWR